MRWPTFGRQTDDPRLAATASLLAELAARQEPLGTEQRERMRAAALAAFRAQSDARARSTPAGRLPRLVGIAVALAAVLALAGTVAAAESGPGQPFYGLRLTIESLTLPSGGSARTQALLAQLDRRLAEARQESAKGDANGVSDAVRAYLTTLSEISGSTGQGVSQTAVDAALQQHVSVLNDLLGSAPAAAQPGLQRALDHTQQALQRPTPAPAASSQPSHPERPQGTPGRP
jgi:Domain of unknown function (DUF5667)